MTGISSLLFTEMPEDPEDAHAWDCSATSGDEYCMSAKQGRMCSRAANNQSLGGGWGEKNRMRVVVGEGWLSYFYLDSMNTAVILLSVCETFLHFPSLGSHTRNNKVVLSNVFVI